MSVKTLDKQDIYEKMQAAQESYADQLNAFVKDHIDKRDTHRLVQFDPEKIDFGDARSYTRFVAVVPNKWFDDHERINKTQARDFPHKILKVLIRY